MFKYVLSALMLVSLLFVGSADAARRVVRVVRPRVVEKVVVVDRRRNVERVVVRRGNVEKIVVVDNRARVPLGIGQGRFSTSADHMPSHHRFVLHTDSDWLLREAAKVGPQTTAYMTALLRSRPYAQQAFRTCLGVLDLARKHPPAHLEQACQRLLAAHLLSYQDLKSELERLAKTVSTQPLPTHENVREHLLQLKEPP